MAIGSKGQVGNYMAAILFFLGFCIFCLFGMVIFLAVKSAMTASGQWTGAVAFAGNKFVNVLAFFDYIAVLLVIMLILGVALTSYRIATSKGFFIVSIFTSLFYTLLSYILNYFFIEYASNPAFSGVLIYFPRIMILATNLHWIALVLFVVGSIALYAKKDGSGDFMG